MLLNYLLLSLVCPLIYFHDLPVFHLSIPVVACFFFPIFFPESCRIFSAIGCQGAGSPSQSDRLQSEKDGGWLWGERVQEHTAVDRGGASGWQVGIPCTPAFIWESIPHIPFVFSFLFNILMVYVNEYSYFKKIATPATIVILSLSTISLFMSFIV